MEDITVTETETIEPSAVEEVVTDIDDMNDSEFNEHFENIGTTDTDTDVDAENIAVDVGSLLNDKYSKQLGDSDGKLDKPVLIKVDGEVMEITSINDLRDMAERGTSVTKKFQKLAEDRRILEEQLAQLGETPDVVPTVSDEIDTIANEILESDYAETFKTIASKLPQDVLEQISSTPSMLNGLRNDVANGRLTEKAITDIHKLVLVKDMSFKDAYIKVTSEYENSTNKDAEKRKNTLLNQPKKTSYTSSNVDVWGMDAKEFDKYFENL